jgi:hypothetical protein
LRRASSGRPAAGADGACGTTVGLTGTWRAGLLAWASAAAGDIMMSDAASRVIVPEWSIL